MTTAYAGFSGLLATLALCEGVVPYELTWLHVLAVPDALRKLFKLNTEAVALVLGERSLDFWAPFMTMCLSLICAWASFTHEGAAAAFAFLFTSLLVYTVNILFGKPKWVCTQGAMIHSALLTTCHYHSQPMRTWRNA